MLLQRTLRHKRAWMLPFVVLVFIAAFWLGVQYTGATHGDGDVGPVGSVRVWGEVFYNGVPQEGARVNISITGTVYSGVALSHPPATGQTEMLNGAPVPYYSIDVPEIAANGVSTWTIQAIVTDTVGSGLPIPCTYHRTVNEKSEMDASTREIALHIKCPVGGSTQEREPVIPSPLDGPNVSIQDNTTFVPGGVTIDPADFDPAHALGAASEIAHPAIAYNVQQNQFLVVWVNNQGTLMLGQRLQGDGTPIGAPFTLFKVGESLSMPSLAYSVDSDEFLLAYRGSTSGVLWQRLNMIGLPVSAPTAPRTAPDASEQHPWLTYLSDKKAYGLVWADASSGLNQVYYLLVDRSGSLVGTPQLLSDAGIYADSPVLTAGQLDNTGALMAVWRQRSGGSWQIIAKLAQADGASLRRYEVMTNPRVQNPAVVFNGSEFLVAWDDGANTWGQRVGTAVGAPFQINNAGDNGTNPALAYNGTGEYYLAAWQSATEHRVWLRLLNNNLDGPAVGSADNGMAPALAAGDTNLVVPAASRVQQMGLAWRGLSVGAGPVIFSRRVPATGKVQSVPHPLPPGAEGWDRAEFSVSSDPYGLAVVGVLDPNDVLHGTIDTGGFATVDIHGLNRTPKLSLWARLWSFSETGPGPQLYSWRLKFIGGDTWTVLGLITVNQPTPAPSYTVAAALPLAGARVDLLNSLGTPIAVSTADEMGHYQLHARPTPGAAYQVQISLQEGTEVTPSLKVISGSTPAASAAQYVVAIGTAPAAVDPFLSRNVQITFQNSLADLSAMYVHTHQALQFGRQWLGLSNPLNPLVVLGYNDVDGVVGYRTHQHVVNFPSGYSAQRDTTHPMNREWHETFHYWMDVAQPTLFNRCRALWSGSSGNHLGLYNPGSCDSYAEGFAEFWALAMCQELGQPRAYAADDPRAGCSYYPIDDTSGGATPAAAGRDLSTPVLAWDGVSLYNPVATPIPGNSREEFAVAGLLWDLYRGMDLPSALNAPTLWTTLSTHLSTPSGNIEGVADLYCVLAHRASPAGVPASCPSESGSPPTLGYSMTQLDALFNRHGFCDFALPSMATPVPACAGRTLGYSGRDVAGTPGPRRSLPPVKNAYVRVNLAGQPVLDGSKLVVVQTDANGHSQQTTYPLGRGQQSYLLYLEPPADGSNGQIRIFVSGPGVHSAPWTFDTTTYWQAVVLAQTHTQDSKQPALVRQLLVGTVHYLPLVKR